MEDEDKQNLDYVVDLLIESVVRFKQGNPTAEDFHTMINVLDYAKYAFSGVAYKYGIPHMIEEDEDDD